MSDQQSLVGYLAHKKVAMSNFYDKVLGSKDKNDPTAVRNLKAKTTVEGRSGIRRITIRDHQIITDSPPAWCGYNLGSSAPELILGALGSCISHMYLVVAALDDVPLTSLEVEVSASIDARKGAPGNEQSTPGLDDISYTVFLGGRFDSEETRQKLESLKEKVEKCCPLYNVIKNPNTITGRIEIVH